MRSPGWKPHFDHWQQMNLITREGFDAGRPAFQVAACAEFIRTNPSCANYVMQFGKEFAIHDPNQVDTCAGCKQSEHLEQQGESGTVWVYCHNCEYDHGDGSFLSDH